MTTPDPILAALGGTIPAARTLLQKRDGRYFSPDEHAIYDLALRALDAPAPDGKALRELRAWVEGQRDAASSDYKVADSADKRASCNVEMHSYQRVMGQIDRLTSAPVADAEVEAPAVREGALQGTPTRMTDTDRREVDTLKKRAFDEAAAIVEPTPAEWCEQIVDVVQRSRTRAGLSEPIRLDMEEIVCDRSELERAAKWLRASMADMLAVAQQVGIVYEAEGHAPVAGPTPAILRAITKIQRDAGDADQLRSAGLSLRVENERLRTAADGFSESVYNCLVAAGAPSGDINAMERAVNAAGTKPSHFVAAEFKKLREALSASELERDDLREEVGDKGFSLLQQERDDLCAENGGLTRERDEARAEYERLAKAHDELGKQAVACERDRCVQADEIATLTRESDAARADQAAMARRELEALHRKNFVLMDESGKPWCVVKDVSVVGALQRLADLPAVKPAEPANPPASPAAGDWPEDGCHENGAYHCACIACGATFIGHKRRVVCKVCSEKTANTPASPDGSAAGAEARLATKVENQRMHIKSLDRVIADLKANGNLRAGKLGAHRREMRRMFADKEQQLRIQGAIIAKLKEKLHGVQVTAPPVPARPAEGEGVEVASRGQGEPEEDRARIVWHVADRTAARRGESGGVDVTEGDRADGAKGESAAAERDQPNAIGRADADDGEGDDRRWAHVTAPDAEARIAEFVEKVNKAINAMCDPLSPTFARGPVEVRAGMDAIRDRTVALMRSLAADNAKAQAEVERLRAEAEQLRADVARTDDKIGAMEIHGNSADYWYRKALARGKANEDLRAKLAEAEAAPKTINMNDRVCVRLTDVGRSVLHANHLAMFGSKRPYMPPSENGGWTAWHLWELMQEFGHRTGMGLPLCFETTIRLSAEAAKPDAGDHLRDATKKVDAGDDAQEGDERMDDWPFRDYEKKYSPFGASSLETAVYHLCRRALRGGGK